MSACPNGRFILKFPPRRVRAMEPPPFPKRVPFHFHLLGSLLRLTFRGLRTGPITSAEILLFS